jgi:hypothetical protein
MMILPMLTKMASQTGDPLGHDRDLHLWRTSIRVVGTSGRDD